MSDNKDLPLAPTPLVSVRKKVLSFYDKMTELYQFLIENSAPPELLLHAKEFPLEIYIDKPAIARLIKISMEEDFEQFGVFFGAEKRAVPTSEPDNYSSFGHLTACFVGLNKENDIIQCHLRPINQSTGDTGGGISPEETWPPGGGTDTIGDGTKTTGTGGTASLQHILYLNTPRHTIDEYFSPKSR